MPKTKEDFDINFQKDIIRFILLDSSFFLLVRKYLRSEFFTSKFIRRIFNYIVEYLHKYGSMPDKTSFYNKFKEDKVCLKICKQIMNSKLPLKKEYLRDELEKFFKMNIFVRHFNRAATLYNEGKVDESSRIMLEGSNEVSQVSFDSEAYEFLFKGFENRLFKRDIRQTSATDFVIPSGIPKLDKAINGGVRNGEFCLLIGDAKSSKSAGLRHFGLSAVKRYYVVLHFQLEDTKEKALDLYDASLLRESYHLVRSNRIDEDTKKKVLEMVRKRRNKDLIISAHTDWDSLSVIEMENIYDDLVLNKGIIPQLVIVDYLELMKPRVKALNEQKAQTMIARDLKTFAMKKNVALWSATQTNRYIDDQDEHFVITGKNVAEDYSKIRISDLSISINSTYKEKEANRARVHVNPGRLVKGGITFRIKQEMEKGIFYIHEKQT